MTCFCREYSALKENWPSSRVEIIKLGNEQLAQEFRRLRSVIVSKQLTADADAYR
jgi:hypothetical protein